MKKLLLIVSSVLLLTSCMTICSKSKQPITFTGMNGTRLYNAANNVKIAEITDGNSVTVNIKKKLSDQTFIAKKEGYVNTPFVVDSEFNAKSLWNILFWPGFLVDLGTGKINKYSEGVYNIEMDKAPEN